MMQMKSKLFAMGAALAAVMGASPASATIYQYTLNTDDVLTINTTTKSATINGGTNDVNLTFTSEEFANFTGGSPSSFTGTLSSISGTSGFLFGEVVNTNLADVGNGTPRISFEDYLPGQQTFNLRGLQWSTRGNIDLGFVVTGYAVLPDPVTVPEPAMLGLFGAGAAMVMIGRRRRDRAGKGGTMAKGQLALAC